MSLKNMKGYSAQKFTNHTNTYTLKTITVSLC